MSKTWKARELQVARFFGTERNPLSGQMSRHSSSDSLHPHLFIENKHRQNHAVIRVWDKAKTLAAKENKIPLVTLTQHNRKGFWVVMHCLDLNKVVDELCLQSVTNLEN